MLYKLKAPPRLFLIRLIIIWVLHHLAFFLCLCFPPSLFAVRQPLHGEHLTRLTCTTWGDGLGECSLSCHPLCHRKERHLNRELIVSSEWNWWLPAKRQAGMQRSNYSLNSNSHACLPLTAESVAHSLSQAQVGTRQQRSDRSGLSRCARPVALCGQMLPREASVRQSYMTRQASLCRKRPRSAEAVPPRAQGC